MEKDPNVMQKGFNKEIVEPHDWKRKEVTDLETLLNLVLDFTRSWI